MKFLMSRFDNFGFTSTAVDGDRELDKHISSKSLAAHLKWILWPDHANDCWWLIEPVLFTLQRSSHAIGRDEKATTCDETERHCEEVVFHKTRGLKKRPKRSRFSALRQPPLTAKS